MVSDPMVVTEKVFSSTGWTGYSAVLNELNLKVMI